MRIQIEGGHYSKADTINFSHFVTMFIISGRGKKMDSVDIPSTVRGHHIYKNVWMPRIGEELAVIVEENNEYDRHAVAVTKNDSIVGHVPRELATTLYFFLKRRGSRAMCVITGHRKYGIGLEVPCVYKVEGPTKVVKKLRKLINSRDHKSSATEVTVVTKTK